ncbi:hypothetical protein U1Q18_029989 [Sarracenia purpurea var. burkii]
MVPLKKISYPPIYILQTYSVRAKQKRRVQIAAGQCARNTPRGRLSLSMAVEQFATSFLLPPYANSSPARRNPVLVLFSSSISTSPFPSNLTRRKNYLRQKLLKTLTKPYPNHILLESPKLPVIPVESPHGNQSEFSREQIASDETESDTREFQISESSKTSGVFSGDDVGVFSTMSVFKLGLFLVGAFVFQTICAVLVLGPANSDQKDGNFDTGGKTRVEKPSILLNGSGVSFRGKFGFKQGGILHEGDSELEDKIVGIQAMARDAREREKSDLKLKGLDNGEIVKTGIEKEVDTKLVKLRKRLQNNREKPLVLPASYLRKDGEAEDGLDRDDLEMKDASKPLMFKKKFKFRSSSTNLGDKPKGFQGLEDYRITKNRSSRLVIEDEPIRNVSVDDDCVELLDEEQKLDQCNGDSQGGISSPLEEDSDRKQPKEKSKPEPRIGATSETGFGRPLVKDQKLRKSSMLDARNCQSLTKEIHETTGVSNGTDMLLRNSISKTRQVGIKQAAGKVEVKQSDDRCDFWWMGLPYVLDEDDIVSYYDLLSQAILVRRGHDGEGPKGLFTLKKDTPYSKDGDDSSSHTVAFEDRGDATNFCYLLQSFFDDLDDFGADIVPLSIKELDEAVSSDGMKVIVVKKGQLKLYAGQPLAEVEMALRSLVKWN